MKGYLGKAAALATLIAAVIPAAATAARDGAGDGSVVIGSPCAADFDLGPSSGAETILPIDVAADGGLASAPFNGVITSWSSNIGYATSPFPQRLMVAGQIADPEVFAMLAPGQVQTLKTGLNTFDARLSIRTGETIAISSVGGKGSPICSTNSDDDVTATTFSELEPGDQAQFAQIANQQVPASAVVEQDADGDGYGDDTQDACRRSARSHKKCPRVRIHVSLRAGARRAVARVEVSAKARIAVTAKARVRGAAGTKSIDLPSAARTVRAGHAGRFKLRYPDKLRRRGSPSHRRRGRPRVRIRMKATATDSVGVKTSAKATARTRRHG